MTTPKPADCLADVYCAVRCVTELMATSQSFGSITLDPAALDAYPYLARFMRQYSPDTPRLLRQDTREMIRLVLLGHAKRLDQIGFDSPLQSMPRYEQLWFSQMMSDVLVGAAMHANVAFNAYCRTDALPLLRQVWLGLRLCLWLGVCPPSRLLPVYAAKSTCPSPLLRWAKVQLLRYNQMEALMQQLEVLAAECDALNRSRYQTVPRIDQTTEIRP